MDNMSELNTNMSEYVPDELLYNFISKSLPGIEVIKLKLPVDVDSNGTEMYATVSHIVGKESDGETAIADACLEFLTQEINKTGHKKLGIYKLLKVPQPLLSDSTPIVLSYAFPQIMNIGEVEDVYEPKFTKDINPFEYKSGDVLKNIEGNEQ